MSTDRNKAIQALQDEIEKWNAADNKCDFDGAGMKKAFIGFFNTDSDVGYWSFDGLNCYNGRQVTYDEKGSKKKKHYF